MILYLEPTATGASLPKNLRNVVAVLQKGFELPVEKTLELINLGLRYPLVNNGGRIECTIRGRILHVGYIRVRHTM